MGEDSGTGPIPINDVQFTVDCNVLDVELEPFRFHFLWRFRACDLDYEKFRRYCIGMSTLAEIEAAAEALPREQKQELLLFLAGRLRAEGAIRLEPRKFTPDELAAWIARDEADMQRFGDGK